MRKRKNYQLPPRPVHLSEVGEPEDLVVRFLGPTGAVVQKLDFSKHSGRPRLMADLAFAYRYHLADKSSFHRENAPYRVITSSVS